jgi:outer membrane protein assembly factor BamB
MRRHVLLWTRLAVAAGLVLAVAPPTPSSAAVAAAADGGVDWPMFHADPTHSGTTTETTLKASNAALLNLRWQANMGNASNTSPAVVYNATLGKRVVYQGSKNGTMAAIDAANGERIWGYPSGAELSSSPAVFGNVVYFGDDNSLLHAVNATTGAFICSFPTGGIINASPVVANTADGLVVYVGDNGTGGGNDGGNIWAINAVDPNAAPDCGLKWSYNAFGTATEPHPEAGSSSPPAFAADANGRNLIVVGSSSSDNAVYAFDALTGARVWRFQTPYTFPDSDVGAGPTVSAPGVNGFASGVAYVTGKNKIVHALNLTTGTQIWAFDIRAATGNADGGTRSTAALDGDRLYVGYGQGVFALNAKTGARLWNTPTDAKIEVISAPALSGPADDRVLFVGDLSGKITAMKAADGAKLWTYQTGNYVYSSAAVSGGKVFIGSGDGFLYAFGVGAGPSAKPKATITYPLDGTEVANPNGSLKVTGKATDNLKVMKVLVAVKSATTNRWWNATFQSWTKEFAQNPATLTRPGRPSTAWSTTFPASPNGGQYVVYADAVDNDGQHSAPVAKASFSVPSLGQPPDTAITSPTPKQVFNLPSPQAPIDITVTGTATDTTGAQPGVQEVMVVIQNIEHEPREYYCGSEGCLDSTGESRFWRPTYTAVRAEVANPGATSTSWSMTFSTFDHPHKYSIVAWAVDRDGEKDPTKARVSPICVRNTGVNSCL